MLPNGRAGDQFHAGLATPVFVHGSVVLPRGTEFTGHITQSDASGRLKGRAVIALTLDSFRLKGKEYLIHTVSVERQRGPQETQSWLYRWRHRPGSRPWRHGWRGERVR